MNHLSFAEYTYNAFYHFIIQITSFKANTSYDSVFFALHLYVNKAISLNAEELTKDIIRL